MHENQINKVNLFLIGARKCATTSLAACLNMHEDICVASNKEPEYFSKDSTYRSDNLSKYHSLFDATCTWKCDASTIYSAQEYTSENVASNIYNYNPDARILYIVRNPFDRIISNYTMAYNRKYTRKTFNESLYHPDKNLIVLSQYYHQISPYLELFPKDQILIIFYYDFIDDQERSIHGILQFLNLNFENISHTDAALNRHQDKLDIPKIYDGILSSKLYTEIKKYLPNRLIKTLKSKIQKSTRLKYKPEYTPEQYDYVYSHLKDDIKALEELTQRNLDFWTK